MPLSTMQKQDFRSILRQLLDDPNSKLWSDTNLDLLTQLTKDSLFSRLHEFDPYFTSQLDTLTSLTTPGYFTTTVTGGSLTKRLHRIQSITRAGVELGEIRRQHVVLEDNTVIVKEATGYFFLGEQVHLLPYDTDEDVEVRYSFKPTLYTSLADTATLTWPDGHEDALLYPCAKRAMMKGGREDSTQFSVEASEAWKELIAVVTRKSHGPLTPFLIDSSLEYGSD